MHGEMEKGVIANGLIFLGFTKSRQSWIGICTASVWLTLGVSHVCLFRPAQVPSMPVSQPELLIMEIRRNKRLAKDCNFPNRSDVDSTSSPTPVIAVVIDHQPTTSTYQISYSRCLVTALIL